MAAVCLHVACNAGGVLLNHLARLRRPRLERGLVPLLRGLGRCGEYGECGGYDRRGEYGR